MTTTTRLPTRDAAPLGADWRAYAACATTDPELFFPIGDGPGAQAQTAEAKRVCARCPVRDRCLNWALDTGQTSGVWGGLSEGDRLRLRRRRPPVETEMDRCYSRKAWIRRQLAAGVSKKTIASQLGVQAVAITKAVRLFDEQDAVEAAIAEAVNAA